MLLSVDGTVIAASSDAGYKHEAGMILDSGATAA
jgi:hypothetical protein